MISVEKAQTRMLALATPLPAETVPLDQAVGRYLAQDIIASRSQPAADLSAMDGYAIRFADLPGPFTLVGKSAAGAPFTGGVNAGDAVRIFTGAHIPSGADTVLVQEEVRADGVQICLDGDGPSIEAQHVRRKAADFSQNDVLVASGTLLLAGAIAAAAMAGYGLVAVGGRPRVKIIATGDELVPPGEPCDDTRLPSSNNVMLQAMLAPLPCVVVDAGIVPDDLTLIAAAFDDADGYDIIVATGGASVGDHDFVQDALKAVGAEIDFWRVAMRPGKPLMAGRIGDTIMLGLPGNPSSAFVTSFLFLLPLVRHLAGAKSALPALHLAPAKTDLGAGDGRTEYMRAMLENGEIAAFGKQDSGMIMPLVQANSLLIRPAGCPAAKAGALVAYMVL